MLRSRSLGIAVALIGLVLSAGLLACPPRPAAKASPSGQTPADTKPRSWTAKRVDTQVRVWVMPFAGPAPDGKMVYHCSDSCFHLYHGDQFFGIEKEENELERSGYRPCKHCERAKIKPTKPKATAKARTEVKLADAAAKTTVIQICDWHMLGAAAFIADENNRRDEPIDADEAVRLYEQHLEDVEMVQRQEVELLTAMLRKLKVAAVLQEGLTPNNLREYKLLADVIARRERLGGADRYREAILRHGATGQLFRAGKIKEVLPLDDAAAMKAANPVNDDGSIRFDQQAIERREGAQVTAILKQKGIVVVVLGGAHDLTSSFRRAGAKVQYLRIEVAGYRKLARTTEMTGKQ